MKGNGRNSNNKIHPAMKNRIDFTFQGQVPGEHFTRDGEYQLPSWEILTHLFDDVVVNQLSTIGSFMNIFEHPVRWRYCYQLLSTVMVEISTVNNLVCLRTKNTLKIINHITWNALDNRPGLLRNNCFAFSFYSQGRRI